jgi:hypothetical protein
VVGEWGVGEGGEEVGVGGGWRWCGLKREEHLRVSCPKAPVHLDYAAVAVA